MRQQIEQTCRRIQPVGESCLASARARQLTLTKPAGSLGRLEETGNRIAAIFETTTPSPTGKKIYVVAADHGVTEEGVSAYSREVTYQMVFNFLRGGAAINVLARHGDIEVRVVDAGVDYDFPADERLIDAKIVRCTANFARGPALTREQATRSVAVGIELAHLARRDGIDLLGIGDMGIGNTTAASAIATVLTGRRPEDVTGRGTGIDDATLARKIAVIKQAIELNYPDGSDPIDILAKVGGAEIGVMMGVV